MKSTYIKINWKVQQVREMNAAVSLLPFLSLSGLPAARPPFFFCCLCLPPSSQQQLTALEPDPLSCCNQLHLTLAPTGFPSILRWTAGASHSSFCRKRLTSAMDKTTYHHTMAIKIVFQFKLNQVPLRAR